MVESEDAESLSECAYWALYANAAYGIALHSMSKPCAMCCAPPCCLPAHLSDGDGVESSEQRVLRGSKCCAWMQIDNSSLKVFLQRTRCGDAQSDLLMASQIGGLHCVNFFVVADHEKQCLVVTIRGTLSLGDSIT